MDNQGFIDNYANQLNDMKVMYTAENIPSRETYHLFDEIILGCNCSGICSIENGCTCMELSPNYNYNPEDTLNTIDSLQNNYELTKRDSPVYECNKHCKCAPCCGNRLVQYGPRKNLTVVYEDELNKLFRVHITENTKGAGLITKLPIKVGNFVCEYAGEVILKTEADIRYKWQEERRLPNYIFSLTENFGDNRIQTFIDPGFFGNIGRYINHSCMPNCEVVPVRCDSAVPKLCIFAKQYIPGNAEITFDYGDGQLGFEPADENLKDKKSCLCKAISCRKFLPFQKYLS